MMRRNNDYLDSVLGTKYPVLDQGFVQPLDYMGDDMAVVEAARTSYRDKKTHTSDNEKLIRYMLRRGHWSPFEQCSIRFVLHLPISVMRQLGRHGTARYNERSTRYSVVGDEMMRIPDDGWRLQSTTNKQGSGNRLNSVEGGVWTHCTGVLFDRIKLFYDEMIEEGVAREQAREVLPLATYTRVTWRCDLRNLLNLFAQRLDPHAQEEIRAYADVMADIVSRWVPLTWRAFVDYQFHGLRFSVQEQKALAELLAKMDPKEEKQIIKSNLLNKREYREFKDKLCTMRDGWRDKWSS